MKGRTVEIVYELRERSPRERESQTDDERTHAKGARDHSILVEKLCASIILAERVNSQWRGKDDIAFSKIKSNLRSRLWAADWIQFFRPRVTGRVEFSARLHLNILRTASKRLIGLRRAE